MDRRRLRPSFEALEQRDTPAGTVTGSFADGTWTLIGDAQDNYIQVLPTTTPGQFTLTGVNTTVTGATNPTGVRNIVVRLLGGNDLVDVGSFGQPASLAGSLKVNGGSGANSVALLDLDVGRNVIVRNGTNASGTDKFAMIDSTVQGRVVLNNGDGDTRTNIYKGSAGVQSIGKSLLITNGAGEDVTQIRDTNIGGRVVFQNGLPDPTTNRAGEVTFYNSMNVTSRSLIGGSLRVVYQGSGINTGDFISDYEVQGNVTLKHGSGIAYTYLDGSSVNQPVLIHGNLTIKDMGRSYISLGRQTLQSGVLVGKNLTITTGNATDTFVAQGLRVDGLTRINTGNGNDSVTIDDSYFAASPDARFGFQLRTGAGIDTVNIETLAAYGSVTRFQGTMHINLGSSADTLTMGAANDPARRAELLGRAVLDGGSEGDTFNRFHVDSVFGAPINTLFETTNV